MLPSSADWCVQRPQLLLLTTYSCFGDRSLAALLGRQRPRTRPPLRTKALGHCFNSILILIVLSIPCTRQRCGGFMQGIKKLESKVDDALFDQAPMEVPPPAPAAPLAAPEATTSMSAPAAGSR